MDSTPLASIPVGAVALVRSATVIGTLHTVPAGRVFHVMLIQVVGVSGAAAGAIEVTVNVLNDASRVLYAAQFGTAITAITNFDAPIVDCPVTGAVSVTSSGTAPTSFRITISGWEEALPV